MKNRYWNIAIIMLFVVAGYVALWQSDHHFLTKQSSNNTAVKDSVEIPVPTFYYGYMIDTLNIIHGVVQRNQNLSEILSPYNITSEKIYDLSKRSKGIFNIRKLGARKNFDLICQKDSLQTAVAMVYFPDEKDFVVFHLSDSVYVTAGSKSLVYEKRSTSGIINNSLAVTISELGLSPQLTNDMADIFAWEVDFFRLYPGDRFKVIYEEQVVDGKPIGTGSITAAIFQHDGHKFFAFLYDKKNDSDYFAENGHSLRKALLKYPVKFSRISSRYSGRRFHPVQKRYKAHRGTDFAAPQGTPIRSVGDGVIVEAKFGKYNGNYVKIKHNSAYSTQYLHMVKIASGIRPGVHISQGQTIGYVGHTGLARGNHVCYRFWRYGQQVDALRVNIPPSNPIGSEDMMDFQLQAMQYHTQLDEIPYPTVDPPIMSGK